MHFQNAGEPLIRLLIERIQRTARLRAGIDRMESAHESRTLPRRSFAPRRPHLFPSLLMAPDFEESGATAVEEIGFTLAAGVDFLAEMQSRGVDIDRAAASIEFSFAIGANYFFQIAKLRAFRMLWAQVVESFGGTLKVQRLAFMRAPRAGTRPSTIHTSTFCVQQLRPCPPFSAARTPSLLRPSTSVTRCRTRPAAGSPAIRKSSSSMKRLLSQVADPGAGSYCLEVITDFIAREGWKSMQRDRSRRRLSKSWPPMGSSQRLLQQSLAAREKAVASRRRVFTGTNQFANPPEQALDRIDP